MMHADSGAFPPDFSYYLEKAQNVVIQVIPARDFCRSVDGYG